MWKRVTELIWMCVCLGRERERERERKKERERERRGASCIYEKTAVQRQSVFRVEKFDAT